MGLTGALLIALGIVCICNPDATLMSLSIVIGIMTLVSGISTMVMWGKMRRYLPTGNMFLSGLLQIILGLIFLNHTFFLAISLPLVFACWIFIEGVILAIRSFDFKQVHFSGWWVILVFGILSALLGFYALTQPFVVSATLLSCVLGTGIILAGIVEFVALFGINKLESFYSDK